MAEQQGGGMERKGWLYFNDTASINNTHQTVLSLACCTKLNLLQT